MGYSVRSNAWRFTVWAKWNATVQCPDWRDTIMELYDHREDVLPVDFDSTENLNVATAPENSAVIKNLTALVHLRFAPGC